MKKTFLDICHENEYHVSTEGVRTPDLYIQKIIPVVEEREHVRSALLECLQSLVFSNSITDIKDVHFSTEKKYRLMALGIQKAYEQGQPCVWGVFQRKYPILDEDIKVNSLGNYDKDNKYSFCGLVGYEKAYEEGGFHTALLGVYINCKLHEASYIGAEDIEEMTEGIIDFEDVQRKMEELKKEGVEGIEIEGKREIIRDYCD